VQTLESELGVQLLSRNNRNVKLTAAGKEFLAGCNTVVDIMESTVNKTVRTSQHELGGLNIGYSYIAMCGRLPQLLTDFEAKNPQTSIDLSFASSYNQLEKLLHDEIDFCFLTGPLDSTDIHTALVQTDSYSVIVPNNHPSAGRESMAVDELAKETILMCADDYINNFNEHVFNFLKVANVHPEIIQINENHIGLVGLVAMGRGVCVATEGYGCIYAKELTTLKLTGVQDQLPTLMAWRKDRPSNAKQKFRDFVLDNTPRFPSQNTQQETELDLP